MPAIVSGNRTIHQVTKALRLISRQDVGERKFTTTTSTFPLVATIPLKKLMKPTVKRRKNTLASLRGWSSLLLALCALALGLALTLAVLRVTWRCGVEHERMAACVR